jgi:hypothetical protein
VTARESAHGGRTVGEIASGDWISFTPYVLADAKKLTARVASAGSGGTLEVRAGSRTGTLLGRATVPATGGWDTYQDVSAPLSRAPKGTTTLYLVFRGSGSAALYELDDFTLTAN